MGEYKLIFVENQRSGEVYTWVKKDGRSMDVEQLVSDLMQQQREVERLRREVAVWVQVACPVCCNDYDVAWKKAGGGDAEPT
jgi:hypothetical protein